MAQCHPMSGEYSPTRILLIVSPPLPYFVLPRRRGCVIVFLNESFIGIYCLGCYGQNATICEDSPLIDGRPLAKLSYAT